MLRKVFENDFVMTGKNKITLTLNKPAYIWMLILELRKVLMYEFHYDYIKNKYGDNSKLLFTCSDSLMYEIKTEDVYEGLAAIKKFLILVIIRLSQNTMMIQTN